MRIISFIDEPDIIKHFFNTWDYRKYSRRPLKTSSDKDDNLRSIDRQLFKGFYRKWRADVQLFLQAKVKLKKLP